MRRKRKLLPPAPPPPSMAGAQTPITDPQVGDRVVFVPSGIGEAVAKPRAGTIIQVHKAHRWYRVSYPAPSRLHRGDLSECFKF